MNFGLICSLISALSATLNGTVQSSEKFDKSASMVLTSSTGEKRTLPLGIDGYFQFDSLEPGVYEVRLNFKKKTVLIPTLLLEDSVNNVTLSWPKSLDPKVRADEVNKAFEIGNQELRSGNYEQAITALKDGLTYDCSQAALWGAISLAEVGQNKLQNALNSGMMAIRLGPKEASYRNNVGTILHRLGRYASAAKRHEEAATLNPDGKGLYLSNAAASYLTGNMDQQALGAYKSALEDPNVPVTTWFHAGSLANRMGESGLAKTYLIKYLELAPSGEFAERAQSILRAIGN